MIKTKWTEIKPNKIILEEIEERRILMNNIIKKSQIYWAFYPSNIYSILKKHQKNTFRTKRSKKQIVMISTIL